MTPQEGTAPSQAADEGLDKVIPRLAGILAHPEFPSGDLAELRRLKPEEPACAAYWRLLTRYVPRSWRRDLQAERDWAVLLQCMAIMAPRIHQQGTSLGRALALLGRDSLEPRFLRLLRSRGRQFREQLRVICRLLASQAQAVDWIPLGYLLLNRKSNLQESIRRHLARDFYSVQQANEAMGE